MITKHGWLLLFWRSGLVVWLALMIQPLSVTLVRLACAGGAVALWLGALVLLWPRRRYFFALLLAGILPGLWLLLPGRVTDQVALRDAYVWHLERYEGTRYAWGGENRLGIDCSGLIRRGWIHANLERGLITLNPAPVRKALSMIWHDRTAMSLGEGADGLTHRLREADSINSLDHTGIAPGTLAVTRNGVHILAYVGGGKWIQASPGEGRVLTQKIPSADPWYHTPVMLIQWVELAANSAVEVRSFPD